MTETELLNIALENQKAKNSRFADEILALRGELAEARALLNRAERPFDGLDPHVKEALEAILIELKRVDW